MQPESIVKVEGVSKKFCRSLKRSMVYGLGDIGKNMMGQSTRSDRLRRDEFWAVEDVSFEVKRGESIGLIGANGSGKTSLLKMLNGIFWPDKGKITMKGRVGALIAVGAGFHPLLTGRENIYANGAILGMTRKEVDQRFDAIVDFAGLEESLDMSVKHYSSGMFVRLGFAIAIHCDPDILLVDEVLTVGDMNFQKKCVVKMQALEKQGVTKIFVSHDLSSVQQLCDKVLHLSRGQVRHYGSTAEIIDAYKKEALTPVDGKAAWEHKVRYGTQQILIKQVEFLDEQDRVQRSFRHGRFFKIKIRYAAKEAIVNPEFAVGISTQDGTLIVHATTLDHGIDTKTVNGDGEVIYSIHSLPLHEGEYLVSIGCWDSTGHVAFDQHEKLYELKVEGTGHFEFSGLVDLPGRWEAQDAAV